MTRKNFIGEVLVLFVGDSKHDAMNVITLTMIIKTLFIMQELEHMSINMFLIRWLQKCRSEPNFS